MVSHPCDTNKSQGWGTALCSGYALVKIRSSQAAVFCCFPDVMAPMMARLKAGMSSGLRLKMNWPSVTTSWSTQFAPAFLRSVLSEGHEVTVLPFSAPVRAASRGRGRWRPWLAAGDELLDEVDGRWVHAQAVGVHDAAGEDEGVVVVGIGLGEGLVYLDGFAPIRDGSSL